MKKTSDLTVKYFENHIHLESRGKNIQKIGHIQSHQKKKTFIYHFKQL